MNVVSFAEYIYADMKLLTTFAQGELLDGSSNLFLKVLFEHEESVLLWMTVPFSVLYLLVRSLRKNGAGMGSAGKYCPQGISRT